MTEATTSGTVIETNPGTVAATTGTADPGSTTAVATDPFSGLDTDTRDWVGKAGLKDVAGLAAKARNAESLIGRSIQLPDDKAKPEDWDKFYGRLGRPEKPEGFEFKLPDGLPENFAYDGERANAFKSIAHAAGLTPKQAAAIHDEVTKADAAAFSALQKTVADNAAAATTALEKAYGGPKDSDAFKQGVNLAVRAIEGLDKIPGVTGLQKALEGAGVLMNGIVMEPTIAIALTEIGKRLFKEDSMVTGGSAAVGDNPFAGDGNMTLQMAMIRSDPSKARRMISAVGKQPADFMWDGKDVPALPR